MGGYLKGTFSRGGSKIFLVIGHIPVEIFLLINCFFDVTLTSNWIFFEGQGNVH